LLAHSPRMSRERVHVQRFSERQPYEDRRHAGAELAAHLKQYKGRADVVVLALPRGGVPVAYEVARALDAPLDVFVVRKLGLPGHPELAMGAIASGGVRVLNDDVVSWYRTILSSAYAVFLSLDFEVLRGSGGTVQEDLELVLSGWPSIRLRDVELRSGVAGRRDRLGGFVHDLSILVRPTGL
jgi:hypothetical protein